MASAAAGGGADGGDAGAAAATWLAASGILTRSVAPVLFAEAGSTTSADPPRASAIARTMASPSPVPPLERDGSAW